MKIVDHPYNLNRVETVGFWDQVHELANQGGGCTPTFVQKDIMLAYGDALGNVAGERIINHLVHKRLIKLSNNIVIREDGILDKVSKLLDSNLFVDLQKELGCVLEVTFTKIPIPHSFSMTIKFEKADVVYKTIKWNHSIHVIGKDSNFDIADTMEVFLNNYIESPTNKDFWLTYCVFSIAAEALEKESHFTSFRKLGVRLQGDCLSEVEFELKYQQGDDYKPTIKKFIYSISES